MITLILDTATTPENLARKFQAAWVDGKKLSASVVLLCAPGEETSLTARFQGASVVPSNPGLKLLLEKIKTPWVAYLPGPVDYSTPALPVPSSGWLLQPWLPPLTLPDQGGMHLGAPLTGWIGSTDLLRQNFSGDRMPLFRDFEDSPFQKNIAYGSVSAEPSLFKGALSRPGTARVLALVPYYNCLPWLEYALKSLVEQTRPLENILVLDDASAEPPLDIVKRFPNVTLWRAAENSGPYRLIQSAIERTHYDLYLFQDADDWSARDRLENLLAEMDRQNADLVGCQEILYLKENAFPNTYPLDATQALRKTPAYSVVHPSGLVKRDFVMKLGGYASGLRFSGDLEFQLRARYAGKLVNSDRFGYFRRIRPDSLVTSKATGLASPARQELDARIRARAAENDALTARGLPPRLEPLASAPPVRFDHLAGPKIEGA